MTSLRKIAQPTRVDDIADDLRRHLDSLQNHEWIFAEHGRVASLVTSLD